VIALLELLANALVDEHVLRRPPSQPKARRPRGRAA
jgi:hypothetical protein